METAADTSAVLVPEARSPGDELSTGVSTPVHSTLICAFMHDILFISLLEQSETLVYIKKKRDQDKDKRPVLCFKRWP